MRHWHLGYPLAGLAPVAGRPCGTWITRFLLCHQETPSGWARQAWPDGGPLLRQLWREVLIDEIIRAELQRIAAERLRRPGRGGAGAT